MVKSTPIRSNIVIQQKKWLFTAGTLIASGISLLIFWPWIMQFVIDQGQNLKPNNFIYDIWKKNLVPLSLDFYFFNWTNPEDIYNKTIKPKFVEIGPFKFTETKEKVNITWNSNNTVSFKHKKTWVFNKEESIMDINAEITTLNPVSVSAAYTVRNWGFWLKKGFQFTLSQVAPELHVTRKVSDMLFDGYDDPMVTLGKHFHFGSGGPPNVDKFGWFYQRNNSEDTEGYFNMDISKENMGTLLNWNTLPYAPTYPEGCNQIDGSAGEFFTPNSLKQDKIKIFTPDLCRSLPLDFVGEEIRKGIKGVKFTAGDSAFDNGTKIPENKCLCTGECVPSGVANITACKFGAPGFVSLPHFYGADHSYLDAVEGMSPGPEHEFFMIFEPTTTLPLSVHAKLQLNLLLQPVKYITKFEKVPRIFFPVLWFQQSVEIPDEFVILVKIILAIPTICQILGLFLTISGLSIITFIMYKPITVYLTQREPNYTKTPVIIMRETESFRKDDNANRLTKEEERMLA